MPMVEEPKPDLSAEISRLQRLQSALKLPEDKHFHVALEEKIDNYKRQVTAAKPFDHQIRSLEAAIQKKQDKKDVALKTQLDQQVLIDTIDDKLPKLEADLLVLKQKKLSELNPQVEAQALQNAQMAAQMQQMTMQFTQLQAFMAGLVTAPGVAPEIQQSMRTSLGMPAPPNMPAPATPGAGGGPPLTVDSPLPQVPMRPASFGPAAGPIWTAAAAASLAAAQQKPMDEPCSPGSAALLSSASSPSLNGPEQQLRRQAQLEAFAKQSQRNETRERSPVPNSRSTALEEEELISDSEEDVPARPPPQ